MSLSTLLLVDDDSSLLTALARRLRLREIAPQLATSADEALKVAHARRPDLAVVDVVMGSDSGLELAAELQAACPGLPFILITGHISAELMVRARRSGAIGLLPKPFEIDQLLELFALHHNSAHVAVPAEEPRASLDLNEWEYIHRVLQACGGSISAASRRLGITRQSLQRKLRKSRPLK
jgi:ActR/RegA family two-component response regulator